MKKTVVSKIIFFISLLALSSSVLAGREAGNGGGAWACIDQDASIRWIKQVDRFEAKNEYNLTLASYQNLGYDEILDELKGKISSMDKELAKRLEDHFKIIDRELVFVDQKLETVNDIIFRVKPSENSCKDGEVKYLQVANYTDYDQVLIDRNLFFHKHFSEYDRAALLLHEVVYAYRRNFYGDLTSGESRKIVAHLLSNLDGEVLKGKMKETLANVNICNRQKYIVTYLMKELGTHDCSRVKLRDLKAI